MPNIQEKFHRGLSSVQRGIQEGKEKIQTSQEIISLKLNVSKEESKRAKLITSIGEIAYLKIRKGEIDSTEFNHLLEELKEVDKYIYNTLKIIEEKTKQDERAICECGNELGATDKFCIECGKQVGVEEKEEDIDYMMCSNCEESIPSTSNFCSCCGHNLR